MIGNVSFLTTMFDRLMQQNKENVNEILRELSRILRQQTIFNTTISTLYIDYDGTVKWTGPVVGAKLLVNVLSMNISLPDGPRFSGAALWRAYNGIVSCPSKHAKYRLQEGVCYNFLPRFIPQPLRTRYRATKSLTHRPRHEIMFPLVLLPDIDIFEIQTVAIIHSDWTK